MFRSLNWERTDWKYMKIKKQLKDYFLGFSSETFPEDVTAAATVIGLLFLPLAIMWFIIETALKPLTNWLNK